MLEDLKYAARSLRRTPGFTVAVIVTLALGIGANTTVFSLLDAVLLRSLPVERPEGLVTLRGGYSYPAFEQFTRRTDLFDGLLATSGVNRARARTGSEPLEPVAISFVSGSYFSTLGVRTLVGGTFTSADDQPGSPRSVAVISHWYWVRHFAADPAVVGRQLTVNRAPLTVVGVAPRTFFGERVGASPDVWIPLSMWGQVVPGRDLVRSPGTAWLELMGRLKDGVTPDRASAVLTVDYRQTLMQIFGNRLQPDVRRDIERATVRLEPAARGLSSLSQQFGRPLRLLMTAVAVVLLIACANIANLFLIRAAAMRRETSLRVALGITQARLFRGFLVESVLLAVVSAAAGLALGVWARDALLLVMSGDGGPLPIHAPLDLRLFSFVAGVAVTTVVLFGIVPAWRAARVDPLAGIKDMASVGTRQHSGPASLLVVGQVAASIVLLVGAGLIVRTVMNLRDADLGFASDQLVLVDVDPRAAGYRGEQYRARTLQLLERLGEVPGVTSITLTEHGILSLRESTTDRMRPPEMPADSPALEQERVDLVGPGYFGTMGIPLVAGRDVTDRDTAAAPRAIVINQTMARHFFGERSPIGQRMLWRDERAWEVVGVAADVRTRGPRDAASLRFYVPYLQQADAELASVRFAVRTANDPARLMSSLRRAVADADPALPPPSIETATELLDRMLVRDRTVALLSSVFGALALGLAVLGLYATLAYRVVRRRVELGVRAALGARPRDLLAHVMRESMQLVISGVAIGVVCALLGSGLVESLLFGVVAADVPTYATVVIGLLASAVAASVVPARRAAAADPIVSLRGR